MLYALFVCGHYFFNAGLSKSAFSTFKFGKLIFCLFVFNMCFLFFMIFKFDIVATFI